MSQLKRGDPKATALRVRKIRASEAREQHPHSVSTSDAAGIRDAAIATDVEEVLRAKQLELQVILDAVPAYIWYKDRDNRILRANQAAAASVGMSPGELEGRSTYDLYPEDAAKYHKDDLEVIESGKPKLGIVEPLLSGTGEKRWVRTDKIPYRRMDGEIIGVIVFAVDITELVQAENALREARDGLEVRVEKRTRQLASAVERLRDEMDERQRTEERLRQQQALLAHLQRLQTVEGMTAQLAHEINQPLASIANFAVALTRFLERTPPDVESARQISEQVSLQALRAGEVVRHLRNFVRREEPQRVVVDLSAVVRDAVELISVEAQQRDVAVRVLVDPQTPRAHADPIQIEQVVVNLLSNSLDAMRNHADERREIVVQVDRCKDGDAQVQVSDNGPGLPPGAPGTLFEPYFTTKTDGLGMGLWIGQSIIAVHGGRMWARNKPDGGALVGFSLPGVAADGSKSVA